jgi:hypothetical protein
MKVTRFVVVSVGLQFMNAVLAGTASATPIVACQSDWGVLQGDMVAVKSSFTNHEDYVGGLKELYSVWPRLEDVKHPFVEEDLTAFQTKLNALATAPQAKLDPAVAQRLTAEAQDVIDCANTLDQPPP